MVDFTESWYFKLENFDAPQLISEDLSDWRMLDLPHDWSIEGAFDPNHPAGTGGGALPGGTGWYIKKFKLTSAQQNKKVFIQFDGVYQNSTVWVNGQKVGNRPNGYISFEYDITNYVFQEDENRIDVKVDNADQPNSRWYSGSGIYRDVRLVFTDKIFIPQWGQKITTSGADVSIITEIISEAGEPNDVEIITEIIDQNGIVQGSARANIELHAEDQTSATQNITVSNPNLWQLTNPYLYTLKTTLKKGNEIKDITETLFGFRSIAFDAKNGFLLNGERVKIQGVCLHHDLGALGAAFNRRAMQRQLEIMKAMGVNAIRTSHNPPAPQVLDLCDEMGILVMDEMFDMWSKKKSDFDYSLYWDEWHTQDLQDFVKRDRNHPSVVIWSVGNEIIEQYNHEDSLGGQIASELAGIVRELDDRPITTANNDTSPENPLLKWGDLDVVGFNYHEGDYEQVPANFPGRPFIATETNSQLGTRGHYDMPSDSIRIWPHRWDVEFTEGNPDHTVSSYDHVRPPWGSTHEDTWRIVKRNDFISGMFIWTGFDYLGEPTPYGWPSRSSYFGLVDLAGFPKDPYFMYQSEWKNEPMLHVFPHWNWIAGQTIDIWAYYNQADEVELFLNGKSQGVKSKGKEDFHVMWRLTYEPGELMVISRKDGQEIKKSIIKTAGEPAQIRLTADRSNLEDNGKDLSFVTVEVLDKDGNLVPDADDLIKFTVSGAGKLKAVDNGCQTSHTSFLATEQKAFNGKCLAIISAGKSAGMIQVTASADGLPETSIELKVSE